MSHPMDETPSDVELILTLRSDNRIDLWQPRGRSGAELADILRRIADEFESGAVRRIE